ncbi:MAG: ATP synthase F1 subunit delta [Deltaproteobacteria bacterium]|nr:ATP synthase F1 subunit delta [Deltaproteobacteria bacterium]
MAVTALARRYAQALLLVGLKQGKFEEFGRELGALCDAMAPSLGTLNSPVLGVDKRRAAVEEILKATVPAAAVANFVRVLVEKRRLAALPDIVEAYHRIADEAAGKVRGRVVSAMPLDEATLGQLRIKLTKRLGKTVTLETAVNPDLIGGVRTQVGSLVIDGSLAGQLRRFEVLTGKD